MSRKELKIWLIAVCVIWASFIFALMYMALEPIFNRNY